MLHEVRRRYKLMGVQPDGFYTKILKNKKKKEKVGRKSTPLLLRSSNQVHAHSVSVEGSSVKPSLPVWVLMHEPL